MMVSHCNHWAYTSAAVQVHMRTRRISGKLTMKTLRDSYSATNGWPESLLKIVGSPDALLKIVELVKYCDAHGDGQNRRAWSKEFRMPDVTGCSCNWWWPQKPWPEYGAGPR